MSAAPSLNLLADAIAYRDRGWACIPVDVEKHPLCGSWESYLDNLPSKAQVHKWFSKPGVAGAAIVAGKASGPVAARDFDQHESYTRWADTYPRLADTLPTVRTSRGFHVYCESDLTRTVKLGDGEYRGKGLIVAPHSLHESGARYEWIKPLPPGRLPFVEHAVFVGRNVSESSEAISEFSAYSDYSETSLSIIEKTLPKQPSERNNRLFDLARGLKFNAGMAGTPSAQLKPIVRRWFDLALPIITTKSFDTTWADFLHGWKTARHPIGADMIDRAALLVDPQDLPVEAEQYDTDAAKRLCGLCSAIATISDSGGNFFLSSHDAAARLGIPQMQCWRLLQMFVSDGVLACVERGNARRATRYRWLGGGQ